MKVLKLCSGSLFLFSLLLFLSTNSYGYDITVAKDGSGNYTTVQAAINAAPNNSVLPFTIFVKDGKYREKITVPSTKTFIQLVGESVANTFIYYDDPATILGTQNSASFSISANDFSAINITFANTFGDGSQAVAVLVNADRAAFKNCRFLGNQDTLYAKGGGTPRHYFKNCYIDGNVDFIFGSSIALFDSCVVYAKSRTASGSSYITAANTTTGQAYGYVFKDCILPSNTGSTLYFLGRPWNNSTSGNTAFNQTVFINSTFGANQIQPVGWAAWDAGTITAQTNYAEYKNKNFDGSLVDVSSRVAWSKQLTDGEAANYTLANMFGAWNPCTVYSGFCDYVASPIAISNFRVVKGASTAQLLWNISWPMTGIRYQIFRSTDNVSFSQINEFTSTNDSSVNFQYVDALPPANSIYYYYVLATKASLANNITDTVLVSSKPTIVSSNSALGEFAQGIGIPSTQQSYNVSGFNLTNDVTITAPIGFQISNDNGITWYNNSTPLVLSPIANILAATTIKVRLNAGALNSYSGNIVHTSLNADDVNVAVSGTTSAEPPIEIVTLQSWPLTVNDQDDPAQRSAGVLASIPSFNKFFISNGTTLSAGAVPLAPYSVKNGQAFGPGTTGNGLWSTASGGTGGNLNRNFYEQFTVTAAAGYSVRVDSLVLLASFYNTSSNTKMAMVYSKNGFGSPADSTDISGADSSGTTMAAERYGAFLKPIILANQTSGPISRYALVLNGATGVTLLPGETLTMRLYFACGSGSEGRYATIKNVLAKGAVLNVVPLKLISFTGGSNSNVIQLQWNTVNEINTDNFIIERSSDGTSFMTIGKVPAKNNSVLSSYSFVDGAIVNGGVFYRLKITDKDGNFAYSAVLRINVNNELSILKVYPNPVKDDLAIAYPKAQSGSSLDIFTQDGRKIRSEKLVENSSSIIINIGGFKPGSYLLLYNNLGKKGHSVHFIKQ